MSAGRLPRGDESLAGHCSVVPETPRGPEQHLSPPRRVLPLCSTRSAIDEGGAPRQPHYWLLSDNRSLCPRRGRAATRRRRREAPDEFATRLLGWPPCVL